MMIDDIDAIFFIYYLKMKVQNWL